MLKIPYKYGLSWWARWGLNPRPRDYESPALTTELLARHCVALVEQAEPNGTT